MGEEELPMSVSLTEANTISNKMMIYGQSPEVQNKLYRRSGRTNEGNRPQKGFLMCDTGRP